MIFRMVVYHCENRLERPRICDVASPRDVAKFVYVELQRSILNETAFFALEPWIGDDVTTYVYFVVSDLTWFGDHHELLRQRVAADLDIPTNSLRAIPLLVE